MVNARGVAGGPDADARAVLRDRARRTVLGAPNVVEEARRHFAQASETARWSFQLLGTLEDYDDRRLRALVQALTDAPPPTSDEDLALFGGTDHGTLAWMEHALVDRFVRVSHLVGSESVIARAVAEQPHLVMLDGHLSSPGALESALLIRAYAPATVVVLVADEPVLCGDARRAGVPLCAPNISPSELLRLIDALLL